MRGDEGAWVPPSLSAAPVPVAALFGGDRVVAMGPGGAPACAEVYYTFNHKGGSNLLVRLVADLPGGGQALLRVSTAHLVFRATKGAESTWDADREAVMASAVAVGDYVFASAGPAAGPVRPALVLHVSAARGQLRSVLTDSGMLLAGGVAASTHSYHEGLHRALFAPLKIVHWLAGPGAVRAGTVQAALGAVDDLWQKLGHATAMGWAAARPGGKK